jgi:CheY-like chemotaxis protein
MSSEIFKDKVAGCTVHVATTGQRVLEIVAETKMDMVLIDFDLPDVDGVTLAHALREVYAGPILITAYPDKTAADAIHNELFAYNDLSGWIRKPIKFDDLAAKIDKFIVNKGRLVKRFETDIETMLVGKGEGRGKRSPKVSGNIVTLSISGALVRLENCTKIKIGDEYTISMDLPDDEVVVSESIAKSTKAAITGRGAGGKNVTAKPTATIKTKAAKMKATVAWVNKGKTEAGIQFSDLTELQKKKLQSVLKSHI